MSGIGLLKKTQKAFVQNQNLGVSEPIVYTHKESLLVENVFAFVESANYNSSNKEKKQNDIIFSNVILQEDPIKLDTISYDNKIWNVREWYKSLDMYVIICDNQKRNKVSDRVFK